MHADLTVMFHWTFIINIRCFILIITPISNSYLLLYCCNIYNDFEPSIINSILEGLSLINYDGIKCPHAGHRNNILVHYMHYRGPQGVFCIAEPSRPIPLIFKPIPVDYRIDIARQRPGQVLPETILQRNTHPSAHNR